MASPPPSSTQPTPQTSQNDSPYNTNTSFSTTISDPSDADLPPSTSRLNSQAQRSQTKMSKPSTPVQHIPTQEAYDQWASVYDTDGNMLQSIDDLELSSLLPKLLKDAVDTLSLGWDWDPARHVRLIDLGCGTGRNTAKLLNHASLFYAGPDRHTSVQVVGLDFSAGMLEVAEEKLEALDWGVSLDLGERFELDLRLERADCFPTVKDKAASPMPDVVRLLPGNVVISTLVLEHVPLKDYFATLAALTWDDCYALVTNMHSEMGRMSQAGFVNAQGVKVRGTSFVYTPEETAQAAKEAGFEVLDLRERKMDADIVEKGLVGERGRKWIGINVWYGLVLKRVGGQNEQAYWEAIRAKNSEK